jgi:hypothetical protein
VRLWLVCGVVVATAALDVASALALQVLR